MAGSENSPEKVRILRELLAEAEVETPRTFQEAEAIRGAIIYIRGKLNAMGRVKLSGD